MSYKRLITGQHISFQLRQRAETMRREMTSAEAILWQHIRARRLEGYHFRRQQVIGGYIVDFYCHQVGVVVEIDGPVHQGQAEYDQQREAELTALGIKVLRFTNEEIECEINQVLAEILRACKVNPDDQAAG